MDGSAPNNLNLVAFSHVNALNIAVVFGPWHVGKESMQIAIAPRPTHTHHMRSIQVYVDLPGCVRGHSYQLQNNLLVGMQL